jgi:hypothetical protein
MSIRRFCPQHRAWSLSSVSGLPSAGPAPTAGADAKEGMLLVGHDSSGHSNFQLAALSRYVQSLTNLVLDAFGILQGTKDSSAASVLHASEPTVGMHQRRKVQRI